ncbi:Mycobacterium numidiamassiliense ORFan, partial [Mycobacterium numidiamassiliense]
VSATKDGLGGRLTLTGWPKHCPHLTMSMTTSIGAPRKHFAPQAFLWSPGWRASITPVRAIPTVLDIPAP